MKTKSLFTGMFLIIIIFLSCATAIHGTALVNATDSPSLSTAEYVGIVLAFYEIVVRVFPTVKNISLINTVIRGLSWLSKALNNEKY